MYSSITCRSDLHETLDRRSLARHYLKDHLDLLLLQLQLSLQSPLDLRLVRYFSLTRDHQVLRTAYSVCRRSFFLHQQLLQEVLV